METQLVEKSGKDLKQKNIEFAAEAVSEKIFYHHADSGHKERLKTALIMFANIILLNSDKNDAVSDTTEAK